MAKHPVEAEIREVDRHGLVATGEVDTLFRDLGCSGVMGTEFDRRSLVRLGAADLTGSGFMAGLDACDGAFLTASPRAFRVALMTWVANVAFSFAPMLRSKPFFSAVPVVALPPPLLAVVVGFSRTEVVVVVAAAALVGRALALDFEAIASWSASLV